MKMFSILSLSTMLVLSSAPADASNGSSERATDKVFAEQVTAGERVFGAFLAACAAHDEDRLLKLTTEDFRLDYALDEPGVYYSVDLQALAGECAASPIAARNGSIANLRILPTGEVDAMFVVYDIRTAGSRISRRQLALLEVRRDRIAHIRYFSGYPETARTLSANAPLALGAASTD